MLENIMLRVPPDPLPEYNCEQTDSVFGMVGTWRIRLLNSHVYTDGKRAFLVRGVQGFPLTEHPNGVHPVLKSRSVESIEAVLGEELATVLDFWESHLKDVEGDIIVRQVLSDESVTISTSSHVPSKPNCAT